MWKVEKGFYSQIRPTSIRLGQMRGFTLESKKENHSHTKLSFLLSNMAEQKLFSLSTFLTV
jgi:hypothetical protein